jgi:hypothetical protein
LESVEERKADLSSSSNSSTAHAHTTSTTAAAAATTTTTTTTTKTLKVNAKSRLLAGLEMCLASYENDLRYLRFLCEFGAPVDSCDYDGRRAAHICCAEGNLECALVLMEFNADFVSDSVKDRW